MKNNYNENIYNVPYLYNVYEHYTIESYVDCEEQPVNDKYSK